MKKSFYFTLLFILSPLSAYASSGVSGFAWIGNNSQLGPDLENPSALAIKMSGLSFDGKNLSGEADIGLAKDDFILGNQDDPLANGNPLKIGEVKFGETIPSDDCFSAGDCYPVSWFQRINSSNSKEGYLSGWAKMEIGDPGKYPEVWVHFKAPTDRANYDCSDASSKRDENYYVCSNKEGKTFGYAWSSGGKSTSLADNPGLGWIDFSEVSIFADSGQDQGENQASENLGSGDSTQNQTSENATNNGGTVLARSCEIDFADSTTNKKTICSLEDRVQYKVSADFTDIKEYEWQCEGEDPETNGSISHECPGEKPPALTIHTNDGTKIGCAAKTTVSIDETSTCQIEARQIEPNGPFKKSLKIFTDDKLEARITGKCLDNIQTDWGQKNLSPTWKNNLVFKAKALLPGDASISATIITEKGVKIDCGEINVDVKEKITWSN